MHAALRDRAGSPDLVRVIDIDRASATEQLDSAIDRAFPLDETVATLRWVDDGHARGKVIALPTMA